ISGIACRKAFVPCEIEYLSEGPRRALFVRLNRQNLEPGDKVRALGSTDTASVLAARARWPLQNAICWDCSVFSFETIKQPIGRCRRLVGKAPRQSDGDIQYKICHCRPCSISFLTGIHRVLPSRAALSRWIAS